MGRSGYSECEEIDEEDLQAWRDAVKAAFRCADGQAFLAELLAALDALPRKRLVAHVLQEAEWSEDGNELVPVKDGDVCAFGAVGRARGIEMPAELWLDDDDYADEAHEEVQALFGTPEHLTREIMYQNDECGHGRRVPLPLHASLYSYENPFAFAYTYLDETPEERFTRMRKWVEKRIELNASSTADTPSDVSEGVKS